MNICIYGASSNKIKKNYIYSVETLGKELTLRGHQLIFGGGASGLMGAVARGVYSQGGYIIGVAPSFFNVDGILFKYCSELILTETMRERKQIMEERADAFIMVPGGIGTFEEFFEIMTLKQLGRHNKPIAVFDMDGYYTDIFHQLNKAIEQDFMKPECSKLCQFFTDCDDMFTYLENYQPDAFDVRHLKNI